MRMVKAAKFIATVIAVIALIAATAFFTTKLYSQWTNKEITYTDPQPKQIETVQTTKQEQPKQIDSKLKEVVASALEGTAGTYAIAIKNLDTGEEYYQNESREFTSASLYKLWVLGATYKKVKSGELSEDQELSESIPTLNRRFGISPQDAELTEGTINLTVEQAINQMITISHNYAAMLLTDTVKLSALDEYAKEQGLTNSRTGTPPITTALDNLKLLENIYRGKAVDKEYSDKMIEVMTKQQLNDGLPKLLPEETKIAHKTGEIGPFKHDAGIVFSENGDYIIVVLTESNAPLAAQQRIAQISLAVYEYFTK